MIKIKSKRVKDTLTDEYVAIKYKNKHTNNNEHLVVINHLCALMLQHGMNKADLIKYITNNINNLEVD